VPRYLDDGNWVPLHKAGVKALPHDRPYSEVEAMFSLSVDLDNGRRQSVRSYARIWRWSRGKVERFLKFASHDTFSERATNEATDGPEKFTYVKPLRRKASHQQDQRRATANDPDPDTKKALRKKKKRKPWNGLGKDLDRLLACDEYIQHLAQNPVLGQWSFAEIRAWCRLMVDKANVKRAQRRETPISMPIALIAGCAARVKPFERPAGLESAIPRELNDAAEAMGVGS
jgi:hypothetical protein